MVSDGCHVHNDLTEKLNLIILATENEERTRNFFNFVIPFAVINLIFEYYLVQLVL